MNTQATDYQRFESFIRQFTAGRESKPVDGDYYDLPGVTVYHTTTLPLPEKGRLEVNQITPEAGTAFEWAAEITLNDKVHGEFVHLVLRPDQRVEETYGKTVLPVSDGRAAEILELLSQASTA